MSLTELEVMLTSWGLDKGILRYIDRGEGAKGELDGDTEAQLKKLGEEFAELCYSMAWAHRDPESAMKEAGDVFTVWVQVVRSMGWSPAECAQMTYDKISKRKGAMVNGAFVKEAE